MSFGQLVYISKRLIKAIVVPKSLFILFTFNRGAGAGELVGGSGVGRFMALAEPGTGGATGGKSRRLGGIILDYFHVESDFKRRFRTVKKGR